jgi:hypothetical protein
MSAARETAHIKAPQDQWYQKLPGDETRVPIAGQRDTDRRHRRIVENNKTARNSSLFVDYRTQTCCISTGRRAS